MQLLLATYKLLQSWSFLLATYQVFWDWSFRVVTLRFVFSTKSEICLYCCASKRGLLCFSFTHPLVAEASSPGQEWPTLIWKNIYDLFQMSSTWFRKYLSFYEGSDLYVFYKPLGIDFSCWMRQTCSLLLHLNTTFEVIKNSEEYFHCLDNIKPSESSKFINI